MSRVITVLMDLSEEDASFVIDTLDNAVAAASADVMVHVVHTDTIETLGDGVVIGPGSPYRDAAAAEESSEPHGRRASRSSAPEAGPDTCWSSMRGTDGDRGRKHAEYGGPGVPVVSLLSCSLVELEIEISITRHSARTDPSWREPSHRAHTLRYRLLSDFGYIASAGGMDLSGREEVRAIERDRHAPFIGTLYQPQRSSSPDSPHPIWTALVGAVGP